MSDTRENAEQEMMSAGIAGGMEDSLGPALGSSFSMPPAAPRPKESQSAMAAVATAEETANPTAGEPTEPVPGMGEWKSTYESYVSHWQAESSEARAKALATREKIEKEKADAENASKEKSTSEKKQQAAKEKVKKDEERLRAELEGSGVSKGSKKRDAGKSERERKVKEAWEMVKDGAEGEPTKEVDARGVTDADILSGQAVIAGQSRPPPKQTAYDPTTSTEPLPPSMQSASPSPTFPMPTESATLSRHSATSQAWEEMSGSPSSGEDLATSGMSGVDDLVKIPRPRDNRNSNPPSQPQSHQHPPSQPPSLTLSIFTMPSHLTFSRVVAVLGINLVLPFINGVMLGFGEIFAREVVKVGRIWYREGGSSVGMLLGKKEEGRSSFGGARGVAAVGLSGSGGFP